MVGGDEDLADDASLLRGAREDPEQFGVFYERHAEAVFAFCVRRTGSVHTAADLTAEVFAAAYVKRGSFRPTGAPPRAWLFGIARRQLAGFHRRGRVADRYRARFGMPTIEVSDDDFARVEALIDVEPLRAALADALAGLPSAQAQALWLRVVDQLPYLEISRRLDCSEGAARVRVSRALTRLSEVLEAP